MATTLVTIRTERVIGGTQHIIWCSDLHLASAVYEAALRRDFFTEADESDPHCMIVFFVQQDELDSLLAEAQTSYNSNMLPLAA